MHSEASGPPKKVLDATSLVTEIEYVKGLLDSLIKKKQENEILSEKIHQNLLLMKEIKKELESTGYYKNGMVDTRFGSLES